MMESLSSEQKEKALYILNRLLGVLDTLKERTNMIHSSDDFIDSSIGLEKLDAACMVIEAIGESFKNLDKLTDKKLLITYPSIDWKQVMGVRDVIAHHYFDIDAEEIFSIIDNDLATLKEAILYFKAELNSNNS